MKDHDIRKILLEYIKTTCKKARIYQEKSIGSSICDVMVVGDCLIGYEIKSDDDNYVRLERQVKAYDAFFRKNYIVVGKSHKKSVEDKIPDYWGILVIEDEKITVVREAKRNKKTKVERQLAILWLLELKNLLNYFNLPMFAQKTKGYIQDRLLENVPTDELEKQIVYELMNRDFSVFGATDKTFYFENETNELGPIMDEKLLDLTDMLSEMELNEEMSLDQWISIYRNAIKVKQAKDDILAMPIERARHAISWEDIEVSLGVPWISKKIIEDFVLFVKYGNHLDQKMSTTKVFYEPITGNWKVDNKQVGCILRRCSYDYGTYDYNALYIIEATLNLREIRLYDSKHKYDERRTLVALENQKKIQELFKSWVWEDEDRKWEIEEAYNKMFGGFKKEHFDGSKLVFPGLNDKYELFDYQKDAVQRIISTPNTLLAFDVGSGKTFIMITAAMLMRESGLSRKNMFVVPNNIVGQWEKIFTDLYPKARLLVIEPKGYKKPLRHKVLSQMKNGNYDGIIIAYSCFEQIPLAKEQMINSSQEKLAELDREIKAYPTWLKDGDFDEENYFCKKALEKKKKSIISIMNEIIRGLDKTVDEYDEITFEQLEINTIFLDEAHNYKNLGISTKMRNVRGISAKGSAKCEDMIMKVRCVQDMNQGRGAVFATGTPLCNSLVDAYTMQVYLQNDTLKELHLDVFDNWIKTFAKPEKIAEVDVTSQSYRYVTRFARFFNLPELSKMFSQIAVFHAMDNDNEIPTLQEYNDCLIPKNTALQNYMDDLIKRSEEIRSGKIDRKWDNMLKVSTDGRKAALDLRLVGHKQELDYSKISNCVNQVMNVYEEYEKSSQLIFCDYSTPKPNEFNVYNELKNELMKSGIPEKEIAFIHSYGTEARKVKLFSDVNAGIVRVLIGSTFKLGIGANVQTKLKAIHHLDVPWRPADMVQREGRILRRGNTYDEVFIYRYICEGSFDAYSWQILEGKQKFISDFLSGSTYQKSSSDLEENVLTFAEVKALALSEPRLKELAELENELATTLILSRKWNENQADIDSRLMKTQQTLDVLLKQKSGAKKIKEIVSEKTTEELANLKENLSDRLTLERIRNGSSPLAIWGIITFTCPENADIDKPFFYIKIGDSRFKIESGKNGSGNATRVVNFFKKISDKEIELTEKIEEKRNLLSDLQTMKKSDNPYREQLQKMQKDVKLLREEIAGDSKKCGKNYS